MTDFPPVQGLVLEVLAARALLGETHWAFPARHRPALEALAKQGLFSWQPGSIPHTCLAWLTDNGRDAMLGAACEPPGRELIEEALNILARESATEGRKTWSDWQRHAEAFLHGPEDAGADGRERDIIRALRERVPFARASVRAVGAGAYTVTVRASVARELGLLTNGSAIPEMYLRRRLGRPVEVADVRTVARPDDGANTVLRSGWPGPESEGVSLQPGAAGDGDRSVPDSNRWTPLTGIWRHPPRYASQAESGSGPSVAHRGPLCVA